MPFVYQNRKGSVLLKIYVQPRASKPGFKGVHDGMLKLHIGAAPVDGKANKAVVAYLAKFFHIPKKEVHIISGDTSRKKQCLLEGLTEEQIRGKLKDSGVVS
jgi:uncharacterized protein